MYEIVFDKEANKALKKLPKHEQVRIIEKIVALGENPRPNGIVALQGNWAGYYRFRAGNYRVIYEVFDEKLIILIIKVAHRGHVYEN